MPPVPVPIKFATYWRQVGKFHVLTCPDVDPKLIVIDRHFEAAVARAEKLFDVEIIRPKPEAA